jgi:uncharacterized membrane protein
MEFFALLLLFTGVVWALPARWGGRSLREAMRYAMGIAFVGAGISHLLMPESFVLYLPEVVPMREAIVYISGVIEIAGGLALIAGRYRQQIGLALAAYLVLVLPGNIYVAVAGISEPTFGSQVAWWLPWLRLPFQAVFISWALYSTGALNLLPSRRQALTAAPIR